MHIDKIIEIVEQEKTTSPFLVAIDGRCGSGKTTLASLLQQHFKCNVIHMDDFFLQPHQRTYQRLNEVGGNIDVERFEKEVLRPLKQRQPFTYQKYDCQRQQLTDVIEVEPCELTIIEGSYSMHPRICSYYDLCFFLEITPQEQLERIVQRNGQKKAEIFIHRWIPLEECYFKEFKIKEKSNYHFHFTLEKEG